MILCKTWEALTNYVILMYGSSYSFMQGLKSVMFAIDYCDVGEAIELPVNNTGAVRQLNYNSFYTT